MPDPIYVCRQCAHTWQHPHEWPAECENCLKPGWALMQFDSLVEAEEFSELILAFTLPDGGRKVWPTR